MAEHGHHSKTNPSMAPLLVRRIEKRERNGMSFVIVKNDPHQGDRKSRRWRDGEETQKRMLTLTPKIVFDSFQLRNKHTVLLCALVAPADNLSR